MDSRIVGSEFLAFDLRVAAGSEVSLNCTVKGVVQRNSAENGIFGILLTFQADATEGSFHFHAQCRVVFAGSNPEMDFDDLKLDSNVYDMAYEQFCTQAGQALAALGLNDFPFPEAPALE